MENNIINVFNLDFSFEDAHIFSNFNLSIQKKVILTIIGHSGCGKTTLLNLIGGLLIPKSGNIEKKGEISYLTQSATLLDYRTAFENSILACDLRNTLTNEKIEKANKLFNLFKIFFNVID